MNRPRTARILQRSPGEVAFDRCFFPLAALCIPSVIMGAVGFSHASKAPVQERTEAELAHAAPASGEPRWVGPAVALVTAGFRLRAAFIVVAAWHDPSVRVLRFSTAGLLLLLTGVIDALRHESFH